MLVYVFPPLPGIPVRGVVIHPFTLRAPSADHRHGEGACVVTGAAELESDRGPVGAGSLLGHDEAHSALHPVERHGGGAPAAPTRAVQRMPCVLLVHPTVEHAHLHEDGARTLPDRAPSHLGPLGVGQLIELRQPETGHLDEFGVHLRAAASATDATQGSLTTAKSFFTCGPSGLSQTGAASPMMERSIPIRWDN